MSVNLEEFRTIEEGSPRIRVIETPLVPPAICVVCGSPGRDGRGFVDFGLSFDFYGAVIFCTQCFIEANKQMGYVPPSKVDEYTARIENLTYQLNRAEAQNGVFRSAIYSIASSPDFDFDSPGDVDLSDVGESKDVSGADQSSESTGPRAEQLAFEQGPDDVSDDAGSDSGFSIFKI